MPFLRPLPTCADDCDIPLEFREVYPVDDLFLCPQCGELSFYSRKDHSGSGWRLLTDQIISRMQPEVARYYMLRLKQITTFFAKRG